MTLEKMERPKPRDKQAIILESITNHRIFEEVKIVQSKAKGKIKVGCAVEAYEYRDGFDYSFFFYGCNIHVSDSFGDTHAERMAIDLALKENCYPITVYVTSTSDDEQVALCGSCRHYISEINENCNIVVFNPDGSIKIVTTIKEIYPNHKNVGEKNQQFFEMCLTGRGSENEKQL